jgi:ribosomal protein S27AE
MKTVVVPARHSTLKPLKQKQQSDKTGYPATVCKTCPNCGAPITDENRYYCRECGAYLRNTSHSNHPQKSEVLVWKDQQNSNRGVQYQQAINKNEKDFNVGKTITAVIGCSITALLFIPYGNSILNDFAPFVNTFGSSSSKQLIYTEGYIALGIGWICAIGACLGVLALIAHGFKSK